MASVDSTAKPRGAMPDLPHPARVACTDVISVTPDFPLGKIGTWLSAVIHSSLDGVIIVDAKGRIVLANREAARLFALAPDRLLGQPFETLLPARLRPEHRAYLQNCITAGSSQRRLRIKLDLQGLRADGEEFLASASISRIVLGPTRFLTLILRELVKHVPQDPQQMQASAALRQLALSSLQTSEIEKRRFSKELYDDLGQSLSVLKLDMDWLENAAPTNDKLPQRIAQMQRLLDNIIIRTKSIASSLRPSLLDDFGIVAAVEWIANGFEKKTGIACELINEGIPERPGDQVESAVFRIIQESLLNIERHAQASHVTIHLWHTEQHLHVVIRDDGIGMDESSRRKPGCRGISAMQERIYALGGSLDFGTHAAGGMSVHASIPFGT